MLQCYWCFLHICNCRRKDFSVHGPILLSDRGIHLRVCIILVEIADLVVLSSVIIHSFIVFLAKGKNGNGYPFLAT